MIHDAAGQVILNRSQIREICYYLLHCQWNFIANFEFNSRCASSKVRRACTLTRNHSGMYPTTHLHNSSRNKTEDSIWFLYHFHIYERTQSKICCHLGSCFLHDTHLMNQLSHFFVRRNIIGICFPSSHFSNEKYTCSQITVHQWKQTNVQRQEHVKLISVTNHGCLDRMSMKNFSANSKQTEAGNPSQKSDSSKDTLNRRPVKKIAVTVNVTPTREYPLPMPT